MSTRDPQAFTLNEITDFFATDEEKDALNLMNSNTGKWQIKVRIAQKNGFVRNPDERTNRTWIKPDIEGDFRFVGEDPELPESPKGLPSG